MSGHGALGRWGPTGWQLVGLLLAISMVATVVTAFSGLLVPLLFSFVLGILAVPLVDRIEARGVPRGVAAFVVVVGIVAVVVASIVVVAESLLGQSGVIRAAVVSAMTEIHEWLLARSIDIGAPGAFVDHVGEHGRRLLAGAASWVTSAFSSLVAFLGGAFIGLFVLFRVLVDWDSIRGWIAAHLGVPGEVGEQIVQDAVDVVRRGFGALTLTSVITSALIGLAMVALDLPLAMTVAVVTFVTSYVPYLGAILAGAFGFLIALGTGEPHDALVLLIVILVVQNVVQTVVGNRLTSTRLSVRPLPSILASVAGMAVAGLIGAIVSTPALALSLAVRRRLEQQHRQPDQPPAGSAELRGS